MSSSPQVLEAFRELADAKQLDREELLDLLLSHLQSKEGYSVSLLRHI